MWRKRGREHEGLEVTVYDRIGWDYFSILRGGIRVKHPCLRAQTQRVSSSELLRRGNLVEMWAFRDESSKLCFAIGKNLDLKLSISRYIYI
ncbi:hypothetical protein IEQ34_010970 [Dendrobium chrysotoxum]|uniref:Uncharacterized protein n=1 Tax=Dendrobium chrysotoxum TaxID=161865 RepID=A0AAV7GXK3_DENCH|nr:hypothetical protein IEQ34_010970 [Dendrobium chrysotoxum]